MNPYKRNKEQLNALRRIELARAARNINSYYDDLIYQLDQHASAGQSVPDQADIDFMLRADRPDDPGI